MVATGPKVASLALMILAGPAARAQTTPIKPADVMGDTNRSGPDGWVEAPITRDQPPSGVSGQKAAGEPARDTANTPPPSRPLPAGDDPGTPMADPAKGPAARVQ